MWILALALVVMPSYSTIPVGGEGRQRVKAGGRRGDGGGARLTTDCAAGDTGERDERVDDEVALDLGPVGCRRRRPLAQPPGREQLERLRADVGCREDEPVDEASLQQRTAAGQSDRLTLGKSSWKKTHAGLEERRVRRQRDAADLALLGRDELAGLERLALGGVDWGRRRLLCQGDLDLGLDRRRLGLLNEAFEVGRGCKLLAAAGEEELAVLEGDL